MRLVALLLCVFLTFRGRRGVSCSDGEADEDDAAAFRCVIDVSARAEDDESLRASHSAKEMCSYDSVPFLSCAAFKGLCIREDEHGFRLEASLRPSLVYTVHARTAEADILLSIRILREKTVSVRPGAGDPAPITGKMIRETPVAKLMQILT